MAVFFGFRWFHSTFLSKVRLRGEMTVDRMVLIMYYWLSQTLPEAVQRGLSLSTETAVYWYGFCRNVACAIAWHDFTPIGGNGDVVEVDESHLFKRKYNVGRLTQWRHVWVVGDHVPSHKEKFETFLRDVKRAYPGVEKTAMKNRYEDILECDCHELVSKE
ncbi:hypothetical protein NQ318_001599 [Aromia moschata]|uniref:Uncharacterized protein n=1 Tax=Aromia moschata TaxID=1265417 RepID=A0AAV8Y159_9CUCU|nr:hypothetical protein NQ318_001599 [Aromia moschata]